MTRFVKVQKKAPVGVPLHSAAVQELLVPMVALLRGSGMQQEQLMSEFRAAVKRTSRQKSRLKVVRIGFDQLDSTVVSRWLKDPAFLNSAGKPADLPLKGAVSVSSLVKASKISISPSRVISSLKEFKSVKEISPGKFRLVRRHLNFVTSDAFPFEPNFQFLVDATRASTWGSRAPTRQPRLFWQNAINTRIPRRYLPEFLEFSHQRGLLFVNEINDWLEAHQEKTGKKHDDHSKGVKRLGVALFGICSDAKTF